MVPISISCESGDIFGRKRQRKIKYVFLNVICAKNTATILEILLLVTAELYEEIKECAPFQCFYLIPTSCVFF